MNLKSKAGITQLAERYQAIPRDMSLQVGHLETAVGRRLVGSAGTCDHRAGVGSCQEATSIKS